MGRNYLILLCVLFLIFVPCIGINYFQKKESEEELVSLFNGFYEIDTDFKNISESENSSLIIRNDQCEFIREEDNPLNISLDYKNVKFDKKKINITATVYSSSAEDNVENNPIINSELILVLNLRNGILQISDLNRQTILGIYTKDNIISNLL
jgi:hypothetical protein